MIDAERIAEMKRLSAEATEGAWKVGEFETLIRTHDDVKVVAETWRLVDGAGAKDAQFIAESRQFVPDIIAAYEEQAKEIDKLRLDLRCSSDVQTGVIKKQAEEIARLRKALEFYADEANYDRRWGYEGYTDSKVTDDDGRIAEEALQNGD